MNGNLLLYRVWKDVHRPVGGGTVRGQRLLFSVGSPAEACDAIWRLQEREKEYPPCRDCTYGLEVLSPNGWAEWHDLDGQNVTALLHANLEATAELSLNR